MDIMKKTQKAFTLAALAFTISNNIYGADSDNIVNGKFARIISTTTAEGFDETQLSKKRVLKNTKYLFNVPSKKFTDRAEFMTTTVKEDINGKFSTEREIVLRYHPEASEDVTSFLSKYIDAIDKHAAPKSKALVEFHNRLDSDKNRSDLYENEQNLAKTCLAMTSAGYGTEAALYVGLKTKRATPQELVTSSLLGLGLKVNVLSELNINKQDSHRRAHPLSSVDTTIGILGYLHKKNSITRMNQGYYTEQLALDRDTVNTGISSAERIKLARGGVAYLKGTQDWKLLDGSDDLFPSNLTPINTRIKQLEEILDYEQKTY